MVRVSLLVMINFFPQINHFYCITSLDDLQDVENHCTHLRKKFHISAFPMRYSLYNWIGEQEISKLKKQIFASNQERRTQKQAQKDMNETE